MSAVSAPVRRRTVTVDVAGVKVGSSHPIAVQSMTNTDTADADATAIQVARLAHAGSELVRVMSLVTIPGLIGPLLGPTLGGWLVEYASWHWIFLINLPVGALGAWFALRFMPDLRGAQRSQFDTLGFLLFGAAIAVFVIAFAVGFSGPLGAVITACLVAGSLLLAPAIILGYAVKAADREDREQGAA